MQTTRSVLSSADQQLVHKVLSSLQDQPGTDQRLKLITQQFLGCPYVRNPLIGSSTTLEVFVAGVQGFDCVTLVETALALAWAGDVHDFLMLLRAIRYRHGEVAWRQRLHYSTDWLRYHVTRGTFSDLTHGAATPSTTRRLSLLAAFPPHSATLRYFPTPTLPEVSQGVVADGDIILFVSTRQELDVFHIGMLFRDHKDVLLRHASRRRGQVVEQPLTEFVHANTMPGFIIARPQQRPQLTPA